MLFVKVSGMPTPCWPTAESVLSLYKGNAARPGGIVDRSVSIFRIHPFSP